MTKRKKRDVVELTLHHNYLQIEHKGVKMQLPVRCAKIIKDMYEMRNAKDEKKDLEHYSKEDFENPIYDVSVFVMNADWHSELQWVYKRIAPMKKR